MHEFKGIVNRTIFPESRRPYIQVQHNGGIHRVEIVSGVKGLKDIKAFDDELFKGFEGIELAELRSVSKHGRVMAVRGEDRQLLGESQILLAPIPWHPDISEGEAYCYGTAVSSTVRGEGTAQILYKAQEITAREAGSTHLTLTVRPENGPSMRARLKAGFRVVGYEGAVYGPASEGGARALMRKDFLSEPTPYAPDILMRRLAAGDIPILGENVNFGALDLALPVKVGDEPDLQAHAFLDQLTRRGYIGIGLLRPQEHGLADDKNLMIFHEQGKPMGVDKPKFKPNVLSDSGKLREVIVGYPKENSQITAATAINRVAESNIGGVDPIARKDEFIDFVETLGREGVRIVRTHAEAPPEYRGNSGIFTRDPAFVIGDLVVIGRLGRQSRVYETQAMREMFAGFRILDLSEYPDVVLEGGDVVPLMDKTVAVGIGQRTNEKGLNLLRRMIPGYEFLDVRHEELHLDVIFNKLARRRVLSDVTRLPGAFVEYINELGMSIVISDPSETDTLGNNVVAVDEDRVVAVKENEKTNKRLEDAGVQVIKVSMPNIIKVGGGPRCITCPVYRE